MLWKWKFIPAAAPVVCFSVGAGKLELGGDGAAGLRGS